ncbi:MAG: fibronectin type III domain-containing protein [Candidatus Heimdallarchaeaceae archaeon]
MKYPKSLSRISVFGFCFLLIIFSSFPNQPVSLANNDYVPLYIHLSWKDDTATTMTISWKTVNETETIVQFGINSTSENEQAGVSGIWHHITLQGLKPDTTYKYRVGNGKIWSPEYTFTTGTGGEHTRFIVWGDSRTDRIARRGVVEAVAPIFHDFSIFTGDLVDYGSKTALWHKWFSDMAPEVQYHPLMPVLGNHEDNHTNYYTMFELPGKEEYYSFDYGPAHFIVLHSCVADYGGTFDEQVQWIQKDLEANKDAKWLFVSIHRPFFASSSRYYEGRYDDLKETFLPILEKYNVTAVFSGHDHFYERLEYNNISFIVTGGAGAPLYKPRKDRLNESIYAEGSYHFTMIDLHPNQLHFRAFRAEDYSLMDEFTINRLNLPDLKVEMVPMRIEHPWNESILLSIVISNIGEQNIVVPTKAQVQNSFGEKWNISVPALTVGERYTYTINWTAPEISLSQWTVALDTENAIDEVIEENNMFHFEINSTGIIPTTKKSLFFADSLIEAMGLLGFSTGALVIFNRYIRKRKY